MGYIIVFGVPNVGTTHDPEIRKFRVTREQFFWPREIILQFLLTFLDFVFNIIVKS